MYQHPFDYFLLYKIFYILKYDLIYFKDKREREKKKHGISNLTKTSK